MSEWDDDGAGDAAGQHQEGSRMTAEPQALRSDARRNRDQIIAAAKTLYAQRGLDEVPMEELARQAGVGVGTLYRRFPDRDTLIREITLDSFLTLLARARESLVDGGLGWESFVRDLATSPEMRFTLRLTVFSPGSGQVVWNDPRLREVRDEITDTLDELVRAGQEAGTLRADVGTGDVVLLVALVIIGLQATDHGQADARHERMLALSLDGLRATSNQPLPDGPLSSNALGPRR
ncbi:TetR/AcrR family transcriptional regulator [Promicromonospora sp. NPDC057138]|uniref:TetR/AcrR family transcriptional regulator n=1 Tax=Promicromonospora sp. NPDC057138 TaxID=3346031 RepID=UPI00362D989D